jgi:putative membrane protein PagO
MDGKLAVAFLFAVVCLTWGTTWIGIKIAVETVPPILASGLRFLIAFPILLVIARAYDAPLRFPEKELGLFLMATFLYFGIPYLLINIGEQYVSSGLAAMLFSTMPIFTLVFSAVLLREPIRAMQAIGIALGFYALFMILREQGAALEYESLIGALAILLAAIMHALCYVTTKKRGAQISIMTFNTLPIGIAGVLLTLIGIVLEQPKVSNFSMQSISALAYLGIVASVGGFLAYFHLLKRLSPVVLSFVFLIFPVIAVALSSLAEGKTISIEFVIYFGLLLLGFGLTKCNTPIFSWGQK